MVCQALVAFPTYIRWYMVLNTLKVNLVNYEYLAICMHITCMKGFTNLVIGHTLHTVATYVASWLCTWYDQRTTFSSRYTTTKIDPCVHMYLYTYIHIYIYIYIYICVCVCDWILENRPKCHTGPIPFYWPS